MAAFFAYFRKAAHTTDERKEIPIDCRKKSSSSSFSSSTSFHFIRSFAQIICSINCELCVCVCVQCMYSRQTVFVAVVKTHTHTGKTLLPRRQRWMTVCCCLVARKPVAAVELANLTFLCLYVCVCFGRCRWPPPPSHCWLVSLSVSVCVCVCVCVCICIETTRIGLLPQLRGFSLYLNRQRCLLPNSSPVAGAAAAAAAVSDLLMKITVLLPALPSLDWPIDRCQLSLGHRY